MADSRFWVGSNGNDILVFDRHQQIDGGPHVFLWNLRTRDMGRHVAKLAKPNIFSVKDENISAAAINSYSEWHTVNGSKWLAEESSYVRDRLVRETAKERERLELLERHTQYLASRGLTGDGTRVASTGRSHRTPPCWRCQKHLDNSIDVECVACGWIICSCGACGCGR
jgi:hypothetical protein